MVRRLLQVMTSMRHSAEMRSTRSAVMTRRLGYCQESQFLQLVRFFSSGGDDGRLGRLTADAGSVGCSFKIGPGTTLPRSGEISIPGGCRHDEDSPVGSMVPRYLDDSAKTMLLAARHTARAVGLLESDVVKTPWGGIVGFRG